MLSRRQALQTGMAVGALYALPGIRFAYAFAQTPSTIPLFDTNLRGIGTIGVANADPTPAPVTGVLHYTLNIDQFQDDGVVPTLGATTLRGYSPTRLLAGEFHRHLGGIIVAHKGQPIQITFKNNLPGGTHIIPNDLTIDGADQGNNRTSTHFHGGLTPWVSDGGPFAWWDPAGRHGVSFLNNQVLNPKAALNEAEYYYPLNQSARFGWYHDHALGITRINAYAGIASAIFIRDAFEASLIPKGLPDLLEHGGREIPLVIQDKVFVGVISPPRTRHGHRSRRPPRQGACGMPTFTTPIAGSRTLLALRCRIRRSSRNSSATPCWSTARRSQRLPSNPGATACAC